MLKQTLLLISFIALLLNCQSQSDNKIVIGKIDSINSKILNENRKIWIYVPEEVSIDSNSKHRFPVVYLLDGDTHFTSVAGMIQLLSTVRDNMVCPEMTISIVRRLNGLGTDFFVFQRKCNFIFAYRVLLLKNSFKCLILTVVVCFKKIDKPIHQLAQCNKMCINFCFCAAVNHLVSCFALYAFYEGKLFFR